jgi:hypothetical protein
MAGKSKRGRHPPRSKRKGRKATAPPAAPKLTEAQATEPAPRDKPTPKPKAPAVAEVSNVAAELRRIGMVAGVIAVILVILALIFA